MPRQYKRTSLQQSWDTGAMQSAIKAVIEDNVPLQTASIIYNVPRNTLKRRVLGKSIFATGGKKILGSIRPVFDEKQEQEIVEHIKEMETRFYGLSKKDVRSLAFNLAEKNDLKHKFAECLYCNSIASLNRRKFAECLYCNSMFSKSKKEKGWVLCPVCKRWAHEEYAGRGSDDEGYICDVCKP
ncbi:CENP-B N-terminal DNA-binding domain [Popillia japonica]|uniref:CENP-B N-terminal DNA-binding domain n=1 Tax=Popillia japonica TaxID=7064 RepID=A0AAW1IV81_POPJA